MNRLVRPTLFLAALAMAGLLAACGTAGAQSRLDRWRSAMGLDDGADAPGTASLPADVRVLRDIAYGADKAQRLDVYLPAHAAAGAAPAPVVFFVHGGAWAFGDKANRQVVEPKMAHWVEQGWVVVSANYRMLPAAPVATQAEDVAAAIAFAQSQAARWHADPRGFVLMGHSAGAHLVALLGAGYPAAARPLPWRGLVLLDSAALNLPAIMENRHARLYDRVFGSDPQVWSALSPIAHMVRAPAPMLAVCSSRRDDSCDQADGFVARAASLGGQARVLREDLSHMQINATLGAPSDYTAQVDAFLQSVR